MTLSMEATMTARRQKMNDAAANMAKDWLTLALAVGICSVAAMATAGMLDG